jgi:hypothetical protein
MTDCDYHVSYEPLAGIYYVSATDGGSVDRRMDKAAAVALAIRRATKDHAGGAQASVCVQRGDGTFAVKWAPMGRRASKDVSPK